eukprot:CAMPEP_0113547266 /NCGR_PEP_ID=MMETSP0015_2-20120614/12260_1 /TAXON_ID=2838 /ORGANISM="Odontella" /LENGTH=243 /DNA_ID=CAMNT_0000447801 /DNA_START=1 /DNA_END=732 /DNA_ORIENTATION=- /assembly_acc=CAM_ASM_000160
MGSMSAMDDSYGVNGNAYPPISDEVVAAASTTFAAPPFCTGSTAMYMSGFRFVLASGDGSMPCLNLFFETWTLDSPAKFVFGALFVFILAAMNEGLSALRRGVRRWMGPGKRRKALSVVTHAIQATMGYVLMLAAMTYAAEMLLAVICGMATGYALFFDDAGRVKGMAMGGDSGGMGKMTADHCLVDDVADEDFRAGGGRGENEEFDNMQTIDEQQAQGGFIEDLSSGIGSGRTYRTSNKKGT